MAKQFKSGKITRKDLASRVLKAAVKTAIAITLYEFAVLYLAPAFDMVSGFAGTVETFFIVYVVLMVAGDLTRHTIVQPFLNGARALLVLFYMILALADSVIAVTIDNATLTLDMNLFFTVAVVLSLVGVASSVLEAINFLSERAEQKSGMQL